MGARELRLLPPLRLLRPAHTATGWTRRCRAAHALPDRLGSVRDGEVEPCGALSALVLAGGDSDGAVVAVDREPQAVAPTVMGISSRAQNPRCSCVTARTPWRRGAAARRGASATDRRGAT